MPADRLFHARLGHSAKVSGLTDLEYRVWTTYVLGADDFGVMRADAVAFQAAHDALSGRPARAVQRSIERLVKAGLVGAFAHQGSRYLYQADWQDFQRVRYPLRTMHPLPAAAEVSAKTRHLWSVHPGGVAGAVAAEIVPHDCRRIAGRFRQLSRRSSGGFRKSCGKHFRKIPALLPKFCRLTHARAKRLTAYGQGKKGVWGERGREAAGQGVAAGSRRRGAVDGAARGVRRR